MENAAGALKIAAAVLIFVVALPLVLQLLEKQERQLLVF